MSASIQDQVWRNRSPLLLLCLLLPGNIVEPSAEEFEALWTKHKNGRCLLGIMKKMLMI